jgi:hypothetical protein
MNRINFVFISKEYSVAYYNVKFENIYTKNVVLYF